MLCRITLTTPMVKDSALGIISISIVAANISVLVRMYIRVQGLGSRIIPLNQS